MSYSIVLVEYLIGDSKFLHEDLSFLTPQARSIFLVSVTIACLGPASTAISTWEWSFIFVQPNVILKAAEFTESLLATRMLASPNAIHPVSSLVFLVVNNVVRELTLLKFVWDRFLLYRFSEYRREVFGS